MTNELSEMYKAEQQMRIIRYSVRSLKQQILTESNKQRLKELNAILTHEERELDKLIVDFPEINI